MAASASRVPPATIAHLRRARDYRTRRRVERAKHLLANANLTVTEVCHLVGFSSLGSFSSRFTELVGRSPSVYQREQAQHGGPPQVPGCFVMAWARPELPARDHRGGGDAPSVGSASEEQRGPGSSS